MTTAEQIAAALANHAEPVEAYVWHSGGGIMLARVDIATDTPGVTDGDSPHLLLSPREDFDGKPGIAVGYYPTWEHTGEWPGSDTMRFADDVEGAYAIVREGAELLVAEAQEAEADVDLQAMAEGERAEDLADLDAALFAFKRATRMLDNVWSRGGFDGDEIDNYPAGLPSFDEFALQVEAMQVRK